MQEVEQWLAKLGMSEYAERFAENRIDFTVLPDLTDQDLKDIGVVLGDRRKILRAIARLDAAPEAVVLDPKPPSTLSVAAVQGLLIEAESHERRDVTLDEIVRDAGGGHLRANYHRLIARAVKGLESTAEARQVIYERARKALIAHLRINQPGLSKAVIVKERLALEDAIRKIEAEAAGESRTPTEPQPAMPSVGMPDGGAASEPPRRDDANPAPTDMPEGGWPGVLPSEQLLSGWSSLETQAVKGFRDVVREVHDFGAVTPTAMQTGQQSREACEEEAIEPVVDPRDLYSINFDAQERNREHAYGPEDEQRTAVPQVRATRGTAPEDERTRRSLSYGALATLLVALITVVGSMAAVFWQWSAITEFYVFLSHTGLKPQGQASHKTPSAQPQLSGRVPQQQSSETRGITMPGGQTAATQRVVLYEETPTDQQGKRYTGSVVWRTDAVSPGPGLAPELAVRADVTIPERSMAMTWSLRRSADKSAYTIETTFNLPANFPGGGIANVPGILMKQSEQSRGAELAGLAVKVMNGFFVIGLSADDTNAQHNEQLLKERSWFDIPILYANGGRAILAMEKGPPGDRAFAEVFAAWERNK
jgi:SAM domain (Sterile alpha motif)